ncbi:hypothetical protein ACIBG8_07795 [Nonomuraea sp. NPDC050556]|uniref:hypothetical protein n=1 Tax=Nonomuraea sp. NPDC050556 TaxID=3364369 RepID=UPI0037A79F00
MGYSRHLLALAAGLATMSVSHLAPAHAGITGSDERARSVSIFNAKSTSSMARARGGGFELTDTVSWSRPADSTAPIVKIEFYSVLYGPYPTLPGPGRCASDTPDLDAPYLPAKLITKKPLTFTVTGSDLRSGKFTTPPVKVTAPGYYVWGTGGPPPSAKLESLPPFPS